MVQANFKYFEHLDEVNSYTATHFIEVAKRCIEEKGICRIALSGGNTPQAWFKMMAEKYRQALDYSCVEVYWVDERWVDSKSEESNFGNANRLWLARTDAVCFPIPTAIETIEHARSEYEWLLKEKFTENALDWVLLGAGVDGHTASIFPQDLSEKESEEWVQISRHPETGQMRLSMSLAFIMRAENKICMITGNSKRALMESLMNGKADHLPIGYVLQAGERNIIVSNISL